MKKIAVFFILKFCVLLNAQNFEIIYQVKYKPQENTNVFRTEVMSLQIQSNISLFSTYNKKIETVKTEEQPFLNFSILKNLDNYTYYGNFNSLKFCIDSKINTLWKLNAKKTEKWNGYTVNEAIINLDNRMWKALYTTEIPILNGPYKFGGLPGLIIKVSSEDGDYEFEMIAIKPIENTEIAVTKFKNHTKLNQEKVLKYIRKFLKDPAADNLNTTNFYGDSFDYVYKGKNTKEYKDMKVYMEEVINKYNNPIDKNTQILCY